MQYVVLLRGINVGGKHMINMRQLKQLLENSGCRHVATYLNSGNALLESDMPRDSLQRALETTLQEAFGFAVPALVKERREIETIAAAVPAAWMNDAGQKTDVAYLFPAIDSEETLNLLPVKREYIDVLYVQGAVVWHVLRENYNRSRLNNVIGSGLYAQMTVRNVNTARFLAAYPWDNSL